MKLYVFDVSPSLTYTFGSADLHRDEVVHVLVQQYLSDDEYSALQQALAARPEAGGVIGGSGGVRKLRWGVEGRGKRDGVRVIYYLRSRQGVVWMLTVYAKSEVESIPGHVLKQIKEAIDGSV